MALTDAHPGPAEPLAHHLLHSAKIGTPAMEHFATSSLPGGCCSTPILFPADSTSLFLLCHFGDVWERPVLQRPRLVEPGSQDLKGHKLREG